MRQVVHSKCSLRSDLVGASALVDVNDVCGARTSHASGDHTLYYCISTPWDCVLGPLNDRSSTVYIGDAGEGEVGMGFDLH